MLGFTLDSRVRGNDGMVSDHTLKPILPVRGSLDPVKHLQHCSLVRFQIQLFGFQRGNSFIETLQYVQYRCNKISEMNKRTSARSSRSSMNICVVSRVRLAS